MSDFVHLHCHSEYSMLDGASKILDLFLCAMEDRQPALALTDHGSVLGVAEHYLAGKKAVKEFIDRKLKGLKGSGQPGDQAKAAYWEKLAATPVPKPILGMEAYTVPHGFNLRERPERPSDPKYDEKRDSQLRKNFHLILLCENETGYRNLLKISSQAYLEGFYRNPRIDQELLAKHAKGLILTSTDIGGEIPQLILQDRIADAKKVIGTYMDIVGRDNYYFELQWHERLGQKRNPDEHELLDMEAKINKQIMRFAKEFDRPLIATNDSHYVRREDAPAHDIMLCIGTQSKMDDTNRLRFANDMFYLRTGAEMTEQFAQLCPEAVRNTVALAERLNVELAFGNQVYHFPKFQPPDKTPVADYFEKLVWDGLKKRYGDPLPGAAADRARHEIKIIKEMGFVEYILIVWEIVAQAKAMGIPVGPGRGSGAGSIVLYALTVTDLDPLRYGLIFERFINPGRNEMPDVDIDFCQSRRGEIIEWMIQRYGRDCVANIITFGTMGAKNAIRDVARVLGHEQADINRWASTIPNGPGHSLSGELEKNADFKSMYDTEPQAKKVIDIARKIEGKIRNAGTHASGVVVADQDVTQYSALYKDPKTGTISTQLNMKLIDPAGLLKIDILGLATLTVIEMTCNLIRQRHALQLNIRQVPQTILDDYRKLPLKDRHRDFPLENMEKTYRLLGHGHALGLFQFESEGMQKLLVGAKPDRLEDLIALNALYRPGPMGQDMHNAFVRRKNKQEPVDYPHPSTKPILENTLGIIVYQEQVIQIANLLCGFTLSEADKLRKAMGKKDKVLMGKYHDQFVAGFGKVSGVPENIAAGIWDQIEKFAEYGFNKSHSTAYAFVALQTAYLKANYPAEFMAALLTINQEDTKSLQKYLLEARRMQVKVLPPDVNRSAAGFTPEDLPAAPAAESPTDPGAAPALTHPAVRFGFGGIKGIGENCTQAILAARKDRSFDNLADFCNRVDLHTVTRASVQVLIKAGAFDGIETSRKAAYDRLDAYIGSAQKIVQDRSIGQQSLFGDATGGTVTASAKTLPRAVGMSTPNQTAADKKRLAESDWRPEEKMEYEREVLGVMLGQTPLQRKQGLFQCFATARAAQMPNLPHECPVILGGIVAEFKPIQTKKGDRMAFLKLEDLSGECDVVIFPRLMTELSQLEQLQAAQTAAAAAAAGPRRNGNGHNGGNGNGNGAKKRPGESGANATAGPGATLLAKDQAIFILGSVDQSRAERGTQVIAERIIAAADARREMADSMMVLIRNGSREPAKMNALKQVVENFRGSTPLVLDIHNPETGDTLIRTEMRVAPCEALEEAIQDTLGDVECIRYRVKEIQITGNNRRRSMQLKNAAPTDFTHLKPIAPAEAFQPPEPQAVFNFDGDNDEFAQDPAAVPVGAEEE